MPWRCPACHLPIRHSDVEEAPRPGTRYRCHICRLELVVDPETGRLTVAPIRTDDPEEKVRRTR
jgi:rubredoxin